MEPKSPPQQRRLERAPTARIFRKSGSGVWTPDRCLRHCVAPEVCVGSLPISSAPPSEGFWLRLCHPHGFVRLKTTKQSVGVDRPATEVKCVPTSSRCPRSYSLL